jgi:hypothetical protein
VKRLVLAGVAVMAAGALGSGCGEEDISSDISPDAVAQAASKTAKAGSYKLDFSGSVSGTNLPAKLPYTGHGAIDGKRRVGKVSLDFSKASGPGSGTDATKLKIDEVFKGLVIYMRSPALTDKLPGGKQWLRLDINSFAKQIGAGPLAGVGEQDPSQSLDLLRAVSGKLEKKGRQRIRGIPTTHYGATVDLRRYPRLVAKSKRRQAAAGAEQLIKLTGTSKFPTDVWVDENKLVRRQTSSFSFQVPGSGRLHLTQQIDLHDFGTPVSVQVPQRKDTFDATKLAGDQLRKQSAP